MKVATRRRAYLREAAIMLALAKLAERFVSPARIFIWANQRPQHLRRFAMDEASWVSWAVEDRGARTSALPRALAAHAMLRRRGIASRLCLGVSRDGDDLTSHAWVEIGQDKIVGGREANGFTRLAEFGGTS